MREHDIMFHSVESNRIYVSEPQIYGFILHKVCCTAH